MDGKKQVDGKKPIETGRTPRSRGHDEAGVSLRQRLSRRNIRRESSPELDTMEDPTRRHKEWQLSTDCMTRPKRSASWRGSDFADADVSLIKASTISPLLHLALAERTLDHAPIFPQRVYVSPACGSLGPRSLHWIAETCTSTAISPESLLRRSPVVCQKTPSVTAI